jgi:hypothetical protein
VPALEPLQSSGIRRERDQPNSIGIQPVAVPLAVLDYRVP